MIENMSDFFTCFLSVFSEVVPQRLCLTRGQGERLPDLIGRASEITYA